MLRSVAVVLIVAGGGSTTTSVPSADFSVGSVSGAVFLTLFAAIPLGISLWALLDAARRPRWAWALTGRRQVVWMASIMAGVLFVVVGLAISGWYLWKVRPQIADAEDGHF